MMILLIMLFLFVQSATAMQMKDAVTGARAVLCGLGTYLCLDTVAVPTAFALHYGCLAGIICAEKGDDFCEEALSTCKDARNIVENWLEEKKSQ